MFFTRPISGVLLSIAILMLILAAQPRSGAAATRCSSSRHRRSSGLDITARLRQSCVARGCSQIADGDGAAGRYEPGSDHDLLIGLD